MTLPNDIADWSAVETREGVRSGRIGAVEAVTAHLARVDAANPSLNAIVDELAEQARARAAEIDNSKDKSATLCGVPVTTKTNVDQMGCATSNGVPAFNQPQEVGDAAVVTNLKNAGAVIIGRTNTPEFSIRWFTSNPLHGITYNPRQRDLTPGGSSGGAAAAVATGMGCLAHGNDLGGSLRYPAYCCGVATLRPSMGVVPSYNPTMPDRPPMAHMMSVQGAIARTVADVRLAMEALRQPAGVDPLWVDVAPPPLPSPPERPLRVGVAPDPFGDGVEEAVAQAVGAAAAHLRDAGAEVEEMAVPHAEEVVPLWHQLLFTEMRALSLPLMERYGSEEFRRVMGEYLRDVKSAESAGELLLALQKRLQLQQAWMQMFRRVDVLLLPVSLAPPFALEQDYRQVEMIPQIVAAQRPLYMVNMMGLPAAQVPVKTLADGTPIGVQIIGAMHHDAVCLYAAEAVEARNGLSTRPVNLAE